MPVSVRVHIALLPLLLAAPALSNEARIQQSGGGIAEFRLDQAPGGGHQFGGVAVDGAPVSPDDLRSDPDAPATLSGDLAKLVVRQAGAGGAVGLDVVAGAASIDIQTASDDAVLIHARAGDLTSTVRTSGDGSRTVNVFVDAAGQTVSHDLTLSGAGDMQVSVSQTAAVALTADITAIGHGAVATFNQSGAGASASVMATLDTGAALTLNQTAGNVSADVSTSIGAGGSLTLNQTTAFGMIDNGTHPAVGSVGAGHHVTVTQ